MLFLIFFAVLLFVFWIHVEAHVKSLAVVLLLASVVGAQPATLVLRDGSILKANIIQPSVEVQTRYGRLTIPFADIRQIEVGSHFHDDILAALKDLGDASMKTRDGAARKILAAGPAAYPFLLEHARASDLEVKTRAVALMKQLQDAFPADRLKESPDDVIVADGLRVSGRIVAPSFKARCILGDIDCKLADVAELKLHHGKAVDLIVETGEQWFDTGVVLHRGSRLFVTAEGSVELWPQGPGQYVTGPKGYTTTGKGGQFPAGALIGRIGDGVPFVLGERYDGVPSEGKLFVNIVPSPWSAPSAGTYRVRVRVE